ncbi:MAG: phosphatase PAP2 family protein [Spirochaetota bacterium]
MNNITSRKDLIRTLLILTFIYLFLQVFLIFVNDKNISRYFWLEHRDIKELIDAGVPEKSGLTPIIKNISDNHFWLLRAGVICTLILTFYYKDKNNDLYCLFKNITISAVLILIIASGLVTWLLKIIVGKPRPGTKLEEYSAFNLSVKYYSFPSGHTSETFSYIIPFMFFIRKYYVIIILSIYGILAAFTRVVLAYHFFSDILFSMYITSLLGWIICYYVEKKKVLGVADQ